MRIETREKGGGRDGGMERRRRRRRRRSSSTQVKWGREATNKGSWAATARGAVPKAQMGTVTIFPLFPDLTNCSLTSQKNVPDAKRKGDGEKL